MGVMLKVPTATFNKCIVVVPQLPAKPLELIQGLHQLGALFDRRPVRSIKDSGRQFVYGIPQVAQKRLISGK